VAYWHFFGRLETILPLLSDLPHIETKLFLYIATKLLPSNAFSVLQISHTCFRLGHSSGSPPDLLAGSGRGRLGRGRREEDGE